MQDVRSLIHQAHTENWEELGALMNLREIDLSGNPIAHFPLVLLKSERLEMLNLANVGLPIVTMPYSSSINSFDKSR